MSYNYVIDSSAWIEYIKGTSKGEKIKSIIEEEITATSILTIAELADKFERENSPFDSTLNFIQSRSAILPITISISLKAAKIKNEVRKKNSKFGLMDAFQLATAYHENARLITGDNDFRGTEDCVIL